MTASFLTSILAGYQWQLSLVTGAGILAATFLLKRVQLLVPTFRHACLLNTQTYRTKMAKPNYAANQRWNRKWGGIFIVMIFLGILPFCLTAATQSLWRMACDIVVILMAYDFVYYLTHRFIFHVGGPFEGPLLWMHAVHHRQHNPGRNDSSYIHPLEVAIGLGLYVATIFVLARVMGPFHVVTIVVTWLAFTEINLHNHDLWQEDRFPFRYLHYASRLHHHHHARFTGGNFATISPLYDWLFGTLDHGEGYRAEATPARRIRSADTPG
jgi:sterol desaturase/sphingolipid hydroxylase (fatty acid hydroxylase superfamily)